MHFLTKSLIFSVALYACLSQCYGQLDPGQQDEVRKLIEDYWNDNKDSYIDQLIDEISGDFGAKFKELTGISIGALIGILIALIIVPNLIILGVIFLCCFFCKCGGFGSRHDSSYQQPRSTTTPVTYGSSAPISKPMPPPKPLHSTSPTPAAGQQSSSGMWPWGGNNGDYQKNQGHQNAAYNRNQY